MVKSQKQIIVFNNSDQLAKFAVRQWVAIAKEAIRKRGRFVVIVSGGKTPEFFYQQLAKFRDARVWQKTHVFWADERFVSRRHSWNNYRMVNKNLLCRVPILRRNIHPISTEEKNVRLSAQKYEKDIKEFLNFKERVGRKFDLAILGMGEDGHTASLFPVYRGWKSQRRLVISVISPKIKFKRVSLSLAVLNAVSRIFFFVIGEKKAKIFSEVLMSKNKFPAGCVHPKGGKVFFLLDKEAVSCATRERYTKTNKSKSTYS